MIKITRVLEEGEAPALRVEGRITEQTMEELSDACEWVAGGEGRLVLDVSGVRFVDTAGARLLRDLEQRGASLTGRSPFLNQLLEQVGAGDEDPPGGAGEARAREALLVERLRRGEDSAFEDLLREHGGRLLAVTRRLLRSESDAQDAVQDAFLSAFRGIASFSGGAKLSTWLHRIAVNAALMMLRSRRSTPERPIEDLLPRFGENGEWVRPPSRWESPCDRHLEREETRALVRRCIDQLPQTYRTVLLLRDIEELDTSEVASMLGVTPNAVKIRLHRARQSLRTLLERADTESGQEAAHSKPRGAAGTVQPRPAQTHREDRAFETEPAHSI
jgi:RNA polymerase sigma-70 factor (ECF subfamily)